MKLGRSVEARVFCKEGEDESAILASFLSLFPFVLSDEKILVDRKTAEGFEHKKIVVLSIHLSKDRHINAFIRSLFGNFTQKQKDTLLHQLDSRIDDHLNFFLRFDKNALLQENKMELTDSGNCFHVRIGVAAYPSNKFAAKKAVEKILEKESYEA